MNIFTLLWISNGLFTLRNKGAKRVFRSDDIEEPKKLSIKNKPCSYSVHDKGSLWNRTAFGDLNF